MYVAQDVPSVRSVHAHEARRLTAVSDHEARLRRFQRFPAEPNILLLEPYYPPAATWGSVKVEQGFLPPLGTISIYRWLKEKNYRVSFVDTQFGDYSADTLKQM